MATYQYKAKKGPDEATAGLVEAETRGEALEKLSQRGYFPLELREYAESGRSPWAFRASITKKDLGFFTRQMADLLESNVPLLRALQLTREQSERPALARMIDVLQDQVRGGSSLSEALKKFPRSFSPLYVNLIYAGEVGGVLNQTLGRLAMFLEQEEEFRSRLAAALAYPALILAVGGLSVLFLMVFVVPRLTSMFLDSGQGMPWIARALQAVSQSLTSVTGAAALALGLGASGWALIQAPQSVRAWIAHALLRAPLWGSVLKKGMIARFARTLSMLLEGGVPILRALEVVSHVLDHPGFRCPMRQALEAVEQGSALSESLKRTGLFPALVCQMIAIGEEANTLERALEKIAAAYERETDRAMKLATSLLEPVMILGVGSVIGVIVVAMLLPIFEISTFVK